MKTGIGPGPTPPATAGNPFLALAWAWPLALWLAGAGCHQRQELSLVDRQGTILRPLEAAQGTNVKAVVLLFLGPDCPISNQYAPEFTRLDAVYSPQGIRFWLVYAGPGITAAAVEAHQQAFRLTCPAGRDPHLQAAKAAGVQVTPEAAVYLPDGRLVYCGRIDDRFPDYGVKRPEPTRRDLEQVLQDVLRGKRLTLQRRPAVGCTLER